jgi:hypothetical protein
MLQLSILHGLWLAFPALTSVICCPSAAGQPPGSRRSRPGLGVRLSAAGGFIVCSSGKQGGVAARTDLVVVSEVGAVTLPANRWG